MSFNARDSGAPAAVTSSGDTFLADLCHKMRTPLNGILGTLELLLDGHLRDDQRELARVAYDSAVSLHDVFEGSLAGLRPAVGDVPRS